MKAPTAPGSRPNLVKQEGSPADGGMVTIREAATRWAHKNGQPLNEGTLRRYLTNGEVDGATKDPSGKWLVPLRWLSQQYTLQIADQQDKSELAIAQVLCEIIARHLIDATVNTMSPSVSAAEERAAEAARRERAAVDRAHQVETTSLVGQLRQADDKAQSLRQELSTSNEALESIRALLDETRKSLEIARESARTADTCYQNQKNDADCLIAELKIEIQLLRTEVEQQSSSPQQNHSTTGRSLRAEERYPTQDRSP